MVPTMFQVYTGLLGRCDSKQNTLNSQMPYGQIDQKSHAQSAVCILKLIKRAAYCSTSASCGNDIAMESFFSRVWLLALQVENQLDH